MGDRRAEKTASTTEVVTSQQLTPLAGAPVLYSVPVQHRRMDRQTVQYQPGSSAGADQDNKQEQGTTYYTSYARVEIAQDGGGATGSRNLEN